MHGVYKAEPSFQVRGAVDRLISKPNGLPQGEQCNCHIEALFAASKDIRDLSPRQFTASMQLIESARNVCGNASEPLT